MDLDRICSTVGAWARIFTLLTLDEPDPEGKIPEFKFCAVRVEPIAS